MLDVGGEVVEKHEGHLACKVTIKDVHEDESNCLETVGRTMFAIINFTLWLIN